MSVSPDREAHHNFHSLSHFSVHFYRILTLCACTWSLLLGFHTSICCEGQILRPELLIYFTYELFTQSRTCRPAAMDASNRFPRRAEQIRVTVGENWNVFFVKVRSFIHDKVLVRQRLTGTRIQGEGAGQD